MVDVTDEVREATLRQLREPQGTALVRVVALPRINPESGEPVIDIRDETHGLGLVIHRDGHRDFRVVITTPGGSREARDKLAYQHQEGGVSFVVRWGPDIVALQVGPWDPSAPPVQA